MLLAVDVTDESDFSVAEVHVVLAHAIVKNLGKLKCSSF